MLTYRLAIRLVTLLAYVIAYYTYRYSFVGRARFRFFSKLAKNSISLIVSETWLLIANYAISNSETQLSCI